MSKRGVILNIDPKLLSGKSVYAICEKIKWLLPDGAAVEEARICDGIMQLRFGGSEALPEVPEGAVYQSMSLYP